MHFVIFGLTVSSSWGNGHATLWRALIKALVNRGHTVAFFERDVPYYASTRDGWSVPDGAQLHLYSDVNEASVLIRRELASADVAMSTSYCPDAEVAAEFILNSPAAVRTFYDLDTPVTLDALHRGEIVPYIPARGLGDFDLVLSYTGGKALKELQAALDARVVAPLYGFVDPEAHAPAMPRRDFQGALSYLGTYADDRQAALSELFLKPAAALPSSRFVLAGAQYPADFPWADNIHFLQHLEPSAHPAFFCSSRATLNITRQAMARNGFCPSGRLFEAAACGACILSDEWEGLDTFFEPEKEILLVERAQDVVDALSRTDAELSMIAQAARRRVLAEHTAEQRVITLESYCNQVTAGASNLACSA